MTVWLQRYCWNTTKWKWNEMKYSSYESICVIKLKFQLLDRDLHKWWIPFKTCMTMCTLFVRFLTVYVSVSTLPYRPLSYGFYIANLQWYVQKNPHFCSTTNQGPWFQIEAETPAPCRWLSGWRGVVFASFQKDWPLIVLNEGSSTPL